MSVLKTDWDDVAMTIVIGLVAVTWMILAFLNGQGHRSLTQDRINACSHAQDVAACIKAVK